MNDIDHFEEQARLLLTSNALGRSDVLLKLFEFLLAGSRLDAPPKEIEIAVSVFGKKPEFDLSQDAAVRVYVHRLRKKLDEFYADAGKDAAHRLTIPRGEYRIVVEPVAIEPAAPGQAQPAPETLPEPAPEPAPPADSTPPAAVRAAPRRRFWWYAGAAALSLNALAWGAFWKWHVPDDGFAAVREQSPWAALLQDNRPLVLLVGDYYIFGEIDRAHGVDRLVREYDINSREELNEYLMQQPQLAARYKDLHLSYLPIGIAQVLRELMPILAPTKKDRDRIRVIMASHLTPGALKQANIVYVGYLSGLGVLHDPVFAGSRYTIGGTPDELIDKVKKVRYVSQEGGPSQNEGKSVDYGYFSTFLGPDGNRIVILAGTRDIGMMQTTEALTGARTLAALQQQAGGAASFEALYEVDGIKQMNLNGRLLGVSPLATEKIWNAAP